MIKVIVIGSAGRMGKRIVANIAESNDLELTGATEYEGSELIGQDAGIIAGIAANGIKITSALSEIIDQADAVIDFSVGDVIKHTKIAIENNCSVVIGTTALGEDGKVKLEELAQEGGRIVFASNMSVGVNLLFALSAKVASILDDEYNIEIIEMHHNQKQDAPSGTAVTLAEKVTEARDLSYEKDVVHGREGVIGKRKKTEVGIHALRGGDVVGDHTVMFATGGERIELTHKASSRDTFVKGALKAVRFLNKKDAGLYNMQDVLGLNL